MKDILNEFSNEKIIKEYSLKRLIRYNTRMRLTDEDVSQHSYFVSLFCLKLFQNLDLTIEEKYEILVKSILHDIAEIETSDLPYDVKEKNPKIKKCLKKIEKRYYKENWNDYFNILYNEKRKQNLILKLADTYSVFQYTLNELILGNKNREIKEIFYNSQNRINKLTEELNNYLKGENK